MDPHAMNPHEPVEDPTRARFDDFFYVPEAFGPRTQKRKGRSMHPIFWFLLGVYAMGVAVSFVSIAFGVALGGKSEELWIPFVCPWFWPLFPFFWLIGL